MHIQTNLLKINQHKDVMRKQKIVGKDKSQEVYIFQIELYK